MSVSKVQQMSLPVLRIIFCIMHLSTVVCSLSKRFCKKLEFVLFNAGSSSHPGQSVIIIYLFTKLPPSLIMTLKIEQMGQSLVGLKTELDFTHSFSYNCSLLQKHWSKFKLA